MAKIRYTKAPIKTKSKKAGTLLVSQALVKKGRNNLKPKLHVNRGDEVVVISGRDKGKIGKVLNVFRDRGKIIVEGVNIVKKHKRPLGPGRPGEIIEMEAPIYSAKVMIWIDTAKKASRVGKQISDSAKDKKKKKIRVAKVNGEQID